MAVPVARGAVDGTYWRHGSVRPAYDRISCPVMLVAGWADGYRNNSFRTVEALRANGVPQRLLAGPWSHAAATSAAPGPRIDLLPEMVAWWDRWLRGLENGVDDGGPGRPAVSAFVRTSTRPAPDLDLHEGFWARWEPAKWVSALRASDPAWSQRCLFRCEMGPGAHVGPSGRYARLQYESEIYAWVLERFELEGRRGS